MTKAGGPIVIVGNAGDDEFTELGGDKSVSDVGAWLKLGFDATFIDTAFEFQTLDDAHRLLGFYFGERGRRCDRLRIQFRVACFVGQGAGVTT